MARALALVVLAVGAAAGAGCPRARTRPDVDGARALARVVFQVEAGPRIPGSPGHARVRAWLGTELERLGARVERQTFVDSTLGRPITLTNVIGRWSPSPGAPRNPVVLCAHYDTRAWADRDPDPARRGDPVPGANDGGSGVAVLLEVAELLAREPAPLAVELVFFDGEDQGRSDRPAEFSLGARGYAARLSDQAAGRPAAAFLFDLVGDAELNIHPERNSWERATNLATLVLEAARATGARHFHSEPLHQVFDDHLPLLDAGIPAVDIIDFDYVAWHTTGDLPDRLSAESLAEVARVAAWIVYNSPLASSRR